MIGSTSLGFIRLSATVVSLLLCLSADATAQEPTITTLHTFAVGTGEGTRPPEGLVEARDGSFYGVTGSGGAAGFGTIFRMTADGTTTTVHSFEAESGYYSALIEGRDRNLYGTASHGFSTGGGIVFRVTPEGVFTVLHTFDFSGAPDSRPPLSGILQATDGDLYGTTLYGGDGDLGTIFKMSLDGSLTTVHSFMGPDGLAPIGILQSADGNFYGITRRGGSTWVGGTIETGPGTFFRMTQEGAFTATDAPFLGIFALSNLVEGVDGNFYGAASALGFPDFDRNLGLIYRVTPSGVFKEMARFNGFNVPALRVSLLRASDTNFYGTAQEFCPSDLGGPICHLDTSYFRMDLEGHVEFLKVFRGGARLTGQLSALIEARDGNLYGTWQGSDSGGQTGGAVVRMSNYTTCNDKLTVRYEEGTLHLGFGEHDFDAAPAGRHVLGDARPQDVPVGHDHLVVQINRSRGALDRCRCQALWVYRHRDAPGQHGHHPRHTSAPS